MAIGDIDRNARSPQRRSIRAGHQHHRVLVPDRFALGILQPIVKPRPQRLPRRSPTQRTHFLGDPFALVRLKQLFEQHGKATVLRYLDAEAETIERLRTDVVVTAAHEINPVDRVVGPLDQLLLPARCRQISVDAGWA